MFLEKHSKYIAGRITALDAEGRTQASNTLESNLS